MKIGIIGCSRANKLMEILSKVKCGLIPTAILDTNEKELEVFIEKNPSLTKFSCEEKFFTSKLFDAVYIASPPHCHFDQSLHAIKYNKHVLCEIPAFQKIDQGQKLVKQFEEKNLIYMMAENFCYTPTNLAISQLFDRGYFGSITYIKSGYIHDCKDLTIKKDSGDLTWRGTALTKISGNDYPTHSLGPVSKWLGIGSGQDKFVSITSFATQEAALSRYYADNFPEKSKINHDLFKRGDISLSVLKTASGAVVELILDTVSNRPSSMAELIIQGSKGSFISGRFDGEAGIISNLHNGKSPKIMKYENFDPLFFLTARDQSKRKVLGRLFPFYKVLKNFYNAVELQCVPSVSIKDAVLWSAVIELSRESVLKGSVEIPFPSILDEYQ